MRCPFFDCGWCYAPNNSDANCDGMAACMGSRDCYVAKACNRIHVVTEDDYVTVIQESGDDDELEEHF